MFKQRAIDDDLQIVWGEVYAPVLLPDADNEIMYAEQIRIMAYNFLINAQVDKIDTSHDNVINGSFVVESFIARQDDKLFIPGAWVVGIWVKDPDLWAAVKKGDYSGFSVEAMVKKRLIKIKVKIPESLNGTTSVVEDHSHTFTVFFSDKGEFLGGYTSDAEDGHSHKILRGTKTEMSQGHEHTFSFVELMPWLLTKTAK